VEAFGSGGAINTHNNYPNNAVLSNASSVQRDLPLNFFMQRYTEAYASEIEHFVDAIVNNKPVPVNGHDGKMAFVIALAAKKSFAEKRPVKVSEVT
jgi:myo-inositol 2-dehydrogenase / D-chiro-inositol 1-dehydrogenase